MLEGDCLTAPSKVIRGSKAPRHLLTKLASRSAQGTHKFTSPRRFSRSLNSMAS